jgi:hypothetical protein
MSNAELRLKNEEGEKYNIPSTKYGLEFFSQLTTCLPVGRQDTNYLPAAAGNIECRTPIEE